MITSLRAGLVLFILALSALAQTQPNIVGQTRGAPGTTWRFFAVSPSGQVMIVDLGAGLDLDVSGAVPVLKVTVPPPPPAYTEVRKLFLPGAGGIGGNQQTFTMDHVVPSARLKVYRNGILQYQAVDGGTGDYTVGTAGTQTTVTFTPVTLGNGSTVPAVSTGDIIQVIYNL